MNIITIEYLNEQGELMTIKTGRIFQRTIEQSVKRLTKRLGISNYSYYYEV